MLVSAMAEMKTKKNRASVKKFLEGVLNERKRADSFQVLEMMETITGEKAAMWGTSIVGFGCYHYRYASGREGDSPLVGFSPRKAALTLYIVPGFSSYETLMKKLGKYKTGRSCLYIKKLEDVHLPTLRELIKRSVKHTAKMHR